MEREGGSVMIDPIFWRNAAACWVRLYSRENRQKTAETVETLWNHAAACRTEERSIVDELMCALTENDEEDEEDD